MHKRATACIRNRGLCFKLKVRAINKSQCQSECEVLLISYFSYKSNFQSNSPPIDRAKSRLIFLSYNFRFFLLIITCKLICYFKFLMIVSVSTFSTTY